MCKVDDKRVHKCLMVPPIGGPSRFLTRMVRPLELVDIGEGRVNEAAQRIAFRD